MRPSSSTMLVMIILEEPSSQTHDRGGVASGSHRDSHKFQFVNDIEETLTLISIALMPIHEIALSIKNSCQLRYDKSRWPEYICESARTIYRSKLPRVLFVSVLFLMNRWHNRDNRLIISLFFFRARRDPLCSVLASHRVRQTPIVGIYGRLSVGKYAVSMVKLF